MTWKDSIFHKGVWNGLKLAPKRKGDKSTSYPYYEIKLPSLSVGYRKQGSHRTRWKELYTIRLKVRGIFLCGHVLQRNSGRVWEKGVRKGSHSIESGVGVKSQNVMLTCQYIMTWVS